MEEQINILFKCFVKSMGCAMAKHDRNVIINQVLIQEIIRITIGYKKEKEKITLISLQLAI